MAVLPLIMTAQGLQPQAPATLRQQLVSSVAATNQDFTDNLPGSLVEDIVSTDVAACVQSDSFLVDLINSISPNGANAFILQQFGNLYGLRPQVATNVTVYVVFYGPPGLVIVEGFLVGDGSYQYVVQDGGIIGANGQSLPLYCIAVVPGTWAVPAGSVTLLASSLPASVIDLVTVTNPTDGIPATEGEAMSDFRDRVMTAGLAASTGMSRYMKTMLANVPGVQARLVSARQDPITGKYIAICGGGDPYQVAYAIWKALFWTGGLLPAPINITNITSTNPAVVTTAQNHNLVTGMVETLYDIKGTGVFPSINGQRFPVTVPTVGGQPSLNTFTIPFDGTPYGSKYTSGGLVTPNPIVEEVSISDWPDVYVIPYVLPPMETVFIEVIWQTDSPNYVSPSAIASLAGPAIQDYINSLPVGVAPINTYDLTSIFLQSTANAVSAEAITVLQFQVSIDGMPVAAAPGTGVIYGDPNSYFLTDLSKIVFSEGGF
jgi:Baseplate J-like protein